MFQIPMKTMRLPRPAFGIEKAAVSPPNGFPDHQGSARRGPFGAVGESLEMRMDDAKLRKLKRDIIITLGVEMLREGAIVPVHLRKIYLGYSDLPAETITAAIHRLEDEEVVLLNEGRKEISLTEKVLQQMQTF